MNKLQKIVIIAAMVLILLTALNFLTWPDER
jgi:hypothetical protein